jgi:hypothetical protein
MVGAFAVLTVLAGVLYYSASALVYQEARRAVTEVTPEIIRKVVREELAGRTLADKSVDKNLGGGPGWSMFSSAYAATTKGK